MPLQVGLGIVGRKGALLTSGDPVLPHIFRTLFSRRIVRNASL